MTNAQAREPHWAWLILIPIVIGLLLVWAGVEDLRAPWVKPPDQSASEASKTQAPGTSVQPVLIKTLDTGGVDVSWTALNDPDLRYYSVDVSAITPIEYTYNVPHTGNSLTTDDRLYPVAYLNNALEEEGRSERVEPGQVWRICVTGMRETPLHVDVTPYVIEGSQSCSKDFKLQS